MKKNIILALFLFFSAPYLLCSQEALVHSGGTSLALSSSEFIEEAKNNIAQLRIYGREFNWEEPYKKAAQKSWSGSAFFSPEEFAPKEGYLLTNYHVVKGAECIEAYFPTTGQEPFECEVIGAYPDLDCALIKIKNEYFPKVKELLADSFSNLSFGNSDSLKPLDPIYAVGYPLGTTGWKVSKGVVSGIDRFRNDRIYLQSDVATNPGNSGGALFNSQGQIIGITTGGKSHSHGVADGISLSVPINEVALIIPRLLRGELVHSFDVSVRCAISTPAKDEYYGNPQGGGVYVVSVYANGFAEQIGLQPGDKISAVKTLDHIYYLDRQGETKAWYSENISVSDLTDRFVQMHVPINLMVYRKGIPLELEIKVDHEILSPVREIFPEFEKERTRYLAFGGLVLMELTDNHLQIFNRSAGLAKYHDKANKNKPVLIITHVVGGSVLDRSRQLDAGDIVTTINDLPVATLSDAAKALEKSKERGFVKVENERQECAIARVSDLLNQEEATAQKAGYESAASLVTK